ncbi:DUF5672 family protein [Aquabacterium sp. G14]|uniref:DUF5672 family protein n=1 Tax=Aquabacterium sp. G14 TaxID=3130164 RepID=UPI0030B2C9D6
MLNLPQVTLCCVDTRLPQMALDAMKICMAQVEFGDACLFTCPNHSLTDVPTGIRVIELDNINSIEAYSHFLLKGMGPYLQTSHMLIVQWDGYVLDPSMWSDDFLTVDYIGAVWPQYDDAHRVGNGGFSLRSRQLLDALQNDAIVAHHPEDVCIARTNRVLLTQRWGIRFADEALAHRFAFERERQTSSSFGFHGMSNMADLLTVPQIDQLVHDAPADLFSSVEARNFIKRLIRRGLHSAARLALAKRASRKSINLSDLRLLLRLYLR